MSSSPRAAFKPRRLLFLAMAATAAIAAGCGDDDDGGGEAVAGATAAAAETQDVKLLLPAPLGLNWSAFLVAREKFWPEMGLDVEGVGTDGSSAVVQQIVAGNAEYGVAGAAAVYQGATEGADVKGIAVLTHDDVARLSVPETDAATTPADLKGKSIGITSAGDGSIPIVQAVMKQAGLDKGDYKMPIVGEGGPAVAQAFKQDRIQAYAHGVSDVAGLTIAGKTPLRSIMPDEFVGLPGNVMTVSEETIADPAKLEVAIKIAKGWIQGAQFVLDDPAAAKDIACKQVPQACTDEATAELAVKLASETTKPLDPEAPGTIDMTKAETLITAVAGKVGTPLEEVLTNDYIAQISEG